MTSAKTHVWWGQVRQFSDYSISERLKGQEQVQPRNPEPEIQNPKSEIRNPKSETLRVGLPILGIGIYVYASFS
jgi:hypothetical protein